MYARYFTFKTKSGMRSELEVLSDQVFGFMKSLQGSLVSILSFLKMSLYMGHLAFGNQNRMPNQPENHFAQERGRHWRS